MSAGNATAIIDHEGSLAMTKNYGFAEEFPQYAFFIGKPGIGAARRYVCVCTFPPETLRGALIVWIDLLPTILKSKKFIKIAKNELEITMNEKLRQAGLI